MKKYLALPLLLALLASCGPTESSLVSSSEKPIDHYENFCARMDQLKSTSSYTADLAFYVVGQNGQEQKNSYGIQKQFGPKAILWEDDENPAVANGVLLNGDQGVFSYHLADSKVVLDEFVTLDGGLSIDQIYDSPTIFCANSLWRKTEEPTVFRSNNRVMADTLAGLSGISALSEQTQVQFTLGSIYAQLEQDAITFRVEGFLGQDNPVIRGEVRLSAIGQTENPIVTSYLESPLVVKAATSWSEEEKQTIAKYFGGPKALELPFPTGASYALKVHGMESHDEVLIADTVSGNLMESYKAQTEAAGFKVTFQEKTQGYLARKEVKEGNVNHIYLIHFTYFSQKDIAASYGQETAQLYPKGRFQIEALYEKIAIYTFQEANDFLAQHSTYAFPAPEFKGVGDVRIDDMSAAYPLIDTALIFLYQVDTFENAKANLLAYGTALEAAGFAEQPTASEFQLVYALSSANAQVTLAISRDDAGNYAGSIEAFFLVKKA